MTLSIPLITTDDDALTAALAYAKGGWYVVPLARATKHPGSVLGGEWQHQSSRDPETIVSWFAATDYGVALHVGRSGGVVIDVDNPEAMPNALKDALLDTGVPFQSTRPDVPFRGHMLFDADGMSYSNSTGGLGVGWGDVRGKNGIIVVAPSEHPSGGEYQWLQTGPVPVLPDDIARALRQGGESEDAATDAEVNAFVERYRDNAKPNLLTAVLRRFADETSAGGSRHQAAVSCAAQIAREALAGVYDAGTAFMQLREDFVFSVAWTDKARCSIAQAEAEFAGIMAWAVAQANGSDPAELREAIHGRTTGPALTPLASPGLVLPHEFWTSRPELMHIRKAAHSRKASADAVLHAVLARISAMQSPTARLDIGMGPIGLNYFTCLIGPSGKGKTHAAATARALIPIPLELAGDRFRDGVPPGSGEGLAEMYMGMIPKDPSDPKSQRFRGVARQNAFVKIDEGEMLTKLGERSGSTFGVVTRSAFSCDTLGQQNATDERTRLVPSGGYSMGMVIGFQPSKMGGFFDEASGGTPQRFTYASVLDTSIPDRCDRPDWPGQLSGEGIGWPAQWYSVIPIRAQDRLDELDDRSTSAARGEFDEGELDAHRALILARVAVLLSVLRADPGGASSEDWELAEQIMCVSGTVRDSLYADEMRRREEARDIETSRHVERAQRIESAKTDVIRVARWITRKADGSKGPELYRRVNSRDRPSYGEAMAYAEASGWVKVDDEDRVTATA